MTVSEHFSSSVARVRHCTLAAVAFCAAVAVAGPAHAQKDATKKEELSLEKVPAPAAKKCEVVVMNLQPRGIPKEQEYVAEILTNSMAAEIAESTGCKVITEADINSMLDFEATKASCGGESDSCMAEIGSALGVDLVIGGVVGRLGSSFTFQAMLRNVVKGEVVARVNETIQGQPELLNHAAKNAGRTLFQLEPLPPLVLAAAPVAQAGTGGALGSTGENAGAVAASDEGGGMNSSTLIGAGLMGSGIVIGLAGGGLALWVEYTLQQHTKSTNDEDGYENLQMVGLASMGAVAIGVAASIVGAGFGVIGMIE